MYLHRLLSHKLIIGLEKVPRKGRDSNIPMTIQLNHRIKKVQREMIQSEHSHSKLST